MHVTLTDSISSCITFAFNAMLTYADDNFEMPALITPAQKNELFFDRG